MCISVFQVDVSQVRSSGTASTSENDMVGVLELTTSNCRLFLMVTDVDDPRDVENS